MITLLFWSPSQSKLYMGLADYGYSSPPQLWDFDLETNQGTFITDDFPAPGDADSGYALIDAAEFGGFIYIAQYSSIHIHRFNPATGTVTEVLTTNGSGDLGGLTAQTDKLIASDGAKAWTSADGTAWSEEYDFVTSLGLKDSCGPF